MRPPPRSIDGRGYRVSPASPAQWAWARTGVSWLLALVVVNVAMMAITNRFVREDTLLEDAVQVHEVQQMRALRSRLAMRPGGFVSPSTLPAPVLFGGSDEGRQSLADEKAAIGSGASSAAPAPVFEAAALPVPPSNGGAEAEQMQNADRPLGGEVAALGLEQVHQPAVRKEPTMTALQRKAMLMDVKRNALVCRPLRCSRRAGGRGCGHLVRICL